MYLYSLYTQMNGPTFIALSYKKGAKACSLDCTPIGLCGVIRYYLLTVPCTIGCRTNVACEYITSSLGYLNCSAPVCIFKFSIGVNNCSHLFSRVKVNPCWTGFTVWFLTSDRIWLQHHDPVFWN
jgi:hypothetical protein